ncbi:hypothetical protein [Magnetospirillum molischianum]|uniref:TIR domain-containing protein n=1 Tax=Magnetospirillum molischianum DSM 120 TaxID=1150626 RepID=H8FRY6_MAGML|nr:hypothetical protein [Magnetospirillum molischianum]CCG41124.1 conserved hypothetical protein [Magnetospirillum molischianum DSM 120]
MFRCYNLEIETSNNNFFNKWLDGEKVRANKNKASVKKNLDAFLNKSGTLQATKLINDWFPEIKSNVFISHSHKDHDLAMGFAGWLSEYFGLNSFIDSCVWGYGDELITILDNEYSKDTNGRYEYEKIKRTTAHVHMMLSTALTKMINSCECVVFINTPSSITSKESAEKGKTQSAWLYTEILMTSLIKPIEPARPRRKAVGSFVEKAAVEKFDAEYDVNLKHMTNINIDGLNAWNRACGDLTGATTLDDLYALK